MEKEKLGQTILDQNMSEENCCLSGSFGESTETNSSIDSSMYLTLVQLSKYLTDNGLQLNYPNKITDEQREQIMNLIEKLLEELKANGKDPSLRIGPGPRYYHAYRVITFALLVLQQSNKEYYDQLQKNYDSLLQNSISFESTSTLDTTRSTAKTESAVIDFTDNELIEKANQLVKYLIEYFKLPSSTTIDDALSQIKLSHILDPSGKDDRIRLLQQENQRLVGMIQTPATKFESTTSSEKTDELVKCLIEYFKLPASTTVDDALSQIKLLHILNPSDKDDQIRALQQENQRLISMIPTPSTNLDSSIQNNSNLGESEINFKQDNEKLQNEISQLRAEADSYNRTLSERENTIKELTNQIVSLKEQANHNDSNDAKLFVLETDNNVLQLKVNDLQEENKRRKEKGHDLHNKLKLLKQEYQNQQVEIESLKMQNDKLQVDLDECKAQLQTNQNNSDSVDLEAKDTEIQRLNQALDELALQQEETIQDLSTENDLKNRLYSLLQKQNLVIAELETKNSELIKSENEKSERFKQLQQVYNNAMKEKENKQSEDDVISNLVNLVKSKTENPEISDQILPILNGNETTTEKVNKIFSLLFDNANLITPSQGEVEDQKSLESRNKRLLIYVCNLAHFIDQLANSQDIQDWFIGDSTPDIRSKLIAEVTHIESYMKANNILEGNEEISEIFAHFPAFIKSKLEKNGVFQAENYNEYIAIIQMFILANEILTKFSEELQSRGTLLMGEMKTMSNELQRLNNSINEKIEDATFELNNKNMNLENDNQKLSEKIEKVQNLLRQASTEPSIDKDLLFKCLGILSESSEFPDLDEEEDFPEKSAIPNKQIEDYIKALENKIHQILANQDQVNEEYSSHVSQLVKNVQDLQDENSKLHESRLESENSQIEKIGELEEEIESLKEQLETLLTEHKNIKEENANLKNLNEEQMKHIGEIGELREKEKSQLKKELEDKYQKEMEELQTAINDLQKLIEEKENTTKEQMKALQDQAKEDVKRLQTDVEIQTKRANEIRGHYEPILADLRTKLSESRTHENNSQDELLRTTSELKELKSQLSTARVDAKMLQMKLNAAEEKMKREKKLTETQYSMKVLTLETEHQNKIDNLKSEMEQKNHNLLVKICEMFKEFVDFGEVISPESVVNLLNRVSDKINQSSKRDAELLKANNEINEAKSILKAQPNSSLLQSATSAAKKLDDFEKRKKKMEDEAKEIELAAKKARISLNSAEQSKEWEDWAKRMSSVVSDNFSVSKNGSEIRFVIEEALMNSIGQRQIWRRIDILRAEKQLLMSNILRNALKSKIQPELSLTTLLGVIIPIRRLQKLSGHLKCAISIPKLDNGVKKATKEDKKYNWPILATKFQN